MKIGMLWRTGLVEFLFAVVLFVCLPSLGRAQTGCAMEKHVVDSWTATVKADQDSIQQLEQSAKSPEEKLAELKPLNARLQNAVQHLQQAKSRLGDCQKKAGGGTTPAPGKPQPVSLSNSRDAGWHIDGLGTLTFGQADPNSQTVAGVLVVQRDGLEGIPRNTKLTMEGALQGNGNGFSISGATLTRGNYLDFRKKEVYAYEYRLTLEAQFDDAKTRTHLSGTATLVRSERYRGDKKGTRLESFSITGNYSAPQVPCATSAPALETEVFDPSNAETSRRYLDRYHQVVAQTSGKRVLSDADVVASAKALLPFMRYVANQQGNAANQSVAQRGLALERDQKTKGSQPNNPVVAYVTGLLGPGTLSTLRTQLQTTSTIARTGGTTAEAAAAAPEVTDAGASLALEIAEGGITIEEIPGGQIIGLGVLGIAGIAEGVYLWEKAHSPSIATTQEENCKFGRMRIQLQRGNPNLTMGESALQNVDPPGVLKAALAEMADTIPLKAASWPPFPKRLLPQLRTAISNIKAKIYRSAMVCGTVRNVFQELIIDRKVVWRVDVDNLAGCNLRQ